MVPNIGWKFYYQYYANLDFVEGQAIFQGAPSVQAKKEGLTVEVAFDDYVDLINDVLPKLGKHGFELTTIYPGLLLGSGYIHEVGAREEFILGFYFDHTTGLPVIPGSSVKGVLRSAFEDGPEYIVNCINKLLGTEEYTVEQIKALTVEIFGPAPIDTVESDFSGQDIFYDAVPIRSYTGKLFEEDTITPHTKPFSDPTPLPFIKVTSGITYQFDFDLKDSGDLTSSVKEKLFNQIIQDLGVGAKTNVGYGQLISARKWEGIYLEEANGQNRQPTGEERPSSSENVRPEIPEKYHYPKSLKDNDEIVGMVIEPSRRRPEELRVSFMIGGNASEFKLVEVPEGAELYDLILVKIKASSSGGVAAIEVLGMAPEN